MLRLNLKIILIGFFLEFVVFNSNAFLFFKDTDTRVAQRVRDASIEEIPGRFSLFENEPVSVATASESGKPKVGIGIQELNYRNIKGFIVYIKIKNDAEESLTAELNNFNVVDGEGYIINPVPLQNLLQRAAMMSETSVPMPNDKNIYFSGAMTSPTGSNSLFSGSASIGNPYDFSSGIAVGIARARKRAGLEILKWAPPLWLRKTYPLGVNESNVGVVYFSNEKYTYPITVSLKVNDQEVRVVFPKSQD
jgi:hypothetical protein